MNKINKIYQYLLVVKYLYDNSSNSNIPIGQVQVGLAHRGFRTKIRGPELFLKFRLSLAGALSSDTSLELTTLIPNFSPL